MDANTADTRTLNAPSGVTSDAGANAYATKFAASPIPTVTFGLNVLIKYHEKLGASKAFGILWNLYVLDKRPAHHIHSFK